MSSAIAHMNKVWRRDNAFDTLTTPKDMVAPPAVTKMMLAKIEANPELRANLAEANRIRRAMMIDAGEKPNDIGWMHALQKQATKDIDSEISLNHEAKATKQVEKDQGVQTHAEINRIAGLAGGY
jgi:hypothetical protein